MKLLLFFICCCESYKKYTNDGGYYQDIPQCMTARTAGVILTMGLRLCLRCGKTYDAYGHHFDLGIQDRQGG
jgi:hypothetical protein